MENKIEGIELTRDDILGFNKLRKERVDIPEIKEGAFVYITEMCAEDRDEWEYETFVKSNPEGVDTKGKGRAINAAAMKNIRASLVARTAVGDNGKRLFSAKDVEALGKVAAKPIDRMFEVAQRINGMRKEDLNLSVKN